MQIRKRTNEVQVFNKEKIRIAMKKALDATNCDYIEENLDECVEDAISFIVHDYVDEDGIVDIENVQDAAEQALAENGFFVAARAFITYRESRKRQRDAEKARDEFAIKLIEGGLGKATNDITEMSDPCAELDVIHNQNASTAGGTIGATILQSSEAISKIFWESMYDPEINEMSQVGEKNEIYIHDMGMVAPYCCGWSLADLIRNGLGGVDNKITSAPAKHLLTICTQLVNFLGIMQNEAAGAQAVSSFDTYLAPFVKADNLDYKAVRQAIQVFVFGVNVSSRWGSQSPFSNITLDWNVPEDLKDQVAIVGGKDLVIDGTPITYGMCQKEADMINKAFLEVMIEGDANGRGFQYPIPTYNITSDFDWSETENNKLLFEMAAKYGTPYFSNYVNSDMKPSDVRSMCCRLRLDLRELRKQNGGNFGAGENTGSIGVVTIDLPQLAYLAEDENDFFVRLEHAMNVAARSLDIKRRVVNNYLAKGAYPYIRAYLKQGFKNHFSTIGLVGMNEACLNANWLGKDLTNQECLDWAGKVLDFMRNKLSDYQVQYGNLFNLEATPAESTCYTLARKDKKKFPGIITAGKPGETPYYTNSTHLPVEKVDDIFDALEKEDDLQTKYTSGTVFHAFLGEKLPSWQSAASLVRKIAENYKLPYFTLSPTYSVCSEHGYIAGEVNACPHCGKKTEVYSRITGYYRPVSNWNDGKAQEFQDRNTYDMTKAFADIAHEKAANKVKEDVSVVKAQKVAPVDNSVVILTTEDCPKCKMAKMTMDKKNMAYRTLTDMDEEGKKLAIAYNVMSAPVLFIPENGQYKVISDFNEVMNFVKTC